MRVLFAASVLAVAAAGAAGAAEVKSQAVQPSGQPAAQPMKERHGALPPTLNAQPSAENGCGVVRIHFALDSSALSSQDAAVLKESAACLKQNQRLQVSVEGNTDERGTSEYNQALGAKRAQAISQFLETQGVSASQLKTVSYGKNNPLCNAKDEECWSRNRRTAIRPACRL
jgi:peptidoglycan-associated lipoprotein